MPADCFVDTNILIYALDNDGGVKHVRARELVLKFWEANSWPWISVQVLQEMHMNLERNGLGRKEVTNIIHDYFAWNVVDNNLSLFRMGLIEQERWKLSLWDSMILAAARKAGVSRLYTEDLNNGQDYGGIVAVNPFVVH
ncbi:MAG: PIN domain-containing protein [Spirochaetales bacterium]|nr:PIN domain-containing protein [Spirochaetales bacterium]